MDSKELPKMEGNDTRGSFGITYMDLFIPPRRDKKSCYYRKSDDYSSDSVNAQDDDMYEI